MTVKSASNFRNHYKVPKLYQCLLRSKNSITKRLWLFEEKCLVIHKIRTWECINLDTIHSTQTSHLEKGIAQNLMKAFFFWFILVVWETLPLNNTTESNI